MERNILKLWLPIAKKTNWLTLGHLKRLSSFISFCAQKFLLTIMKNGSKRVYPNTEIFRIKIKCLFLMKVKVKCHKWLQLTLDTLLPFKGIYDHMNQCKIQWSEQEFLSWPQLPLNHITLHSCVLRCARHAKKFFKSFTFQRMVLRNIKSHRKCIFRNISLGFT